MEMERVQNGASGEMGKKCSGSELNYLIYLIYKRTISYLTGSVKSSSVAYFRLADCQS